MNPNDVQTLPRVRAAHRTRLTAGVAACLFLVAQASSQTLPVPGQSTQQPPANRDESPSDPAAIGFLSGFVDHRVYSLPRANAQAIQGKARVTLRPAVGETQTLMYNFSQDYEEGTIRMGVDGNVPPQLQPYVGQMSNILSSVFLPSAAETSKNFIVKLSDFGEEVRLEFKPRTPDIGYLISTQYFKPDGTPLRNVMKIPNPSGVEPMLVTVEYKMEQINGKMFIASDVTRSGGAEIETKYRWVQIGPFITLHQVTRTAPQFTVIVDFTCQVIPKA